MRVLLLLVGLAALFSVCSASFAPVGGACTNFQARSDKQNAYGAACGSDPEDAACILVSDFSDCVGTLTVGDTTGICGGNTATFTSASAIQALLPVSGTDTGTLSTDYTNPTTTSASRFLAHLVAVELSVRFDRCDLWYGQIGTQLGNMVAGTGDCEGYTVDEILAESNRVIGGCGSSSSGLGLENLSVSDLSACLARIAKNFPDNGNSNEGRLCIPTCENIDFNDLGLVSGDHFEGSVYGDFQPFYYSFGISVTSQSVTNVATETTTFPITVFDTANPTGGATHLGTPNAAFGGPGIGDGGASGSFQNAFALGLSLVINNNRNFGAPDDRGAPGGWFEFQFDDIRTVYGVELLHTDAPESGGFVVLLDQYFSPVEFHEILHSGTNGYQLVRFGGGASGCSDFDGVDAYAMRIRLRGGGAVSSIRFCPTEDDDDLGVLSGSLICENVQTFTIANLPFTAPTSSLGEISLSQNGVKIVTYTDGPNTDRGAGNGFFRLPNLPAGTYTASFRPPASSGVTIADRTVTITGGECTDLQVFIFCQDPPTPDRKSVV